MPQIKHVVLLKIRRDVTPELLAEVMAELGELRRVIPGILDFSWGANNSQEGLHQGFTHGFVMTFADLAAVSAYMPHPEHERVKGRIVPLLEGGLAGALIVDWEVA
ncbi:MAG: Dabb family protein [Pirellulales bacterium]|jgi:hypothetical protein|nr:Dabb family protein [Pirellulales bacterium]